MRSLVFKTAAAVAALSCAYAILLAAPAWPSRGPDAAGQGREKLLEAGTPIFNEPVKVVGVKLGNRDVRLGEKFASDEKDWLRGAKFRLKNVAGRKVVFIELDVDFPETRASGAEASYRINLGQIPNINHPAAPLSVLPGDELEADIDEKRYENMRRLVGERHSLSDLSRARVHVGFVVFEDGTAWSAGSFYRQDPNNPRRWVPVSN